MPGGDRTGPMGMGPGTGRAAGLCVGFDSPGYASSRYGPGFGSGRGVVGGFARGWRHRNWFHATGVPGWARSGFGPRWGMHQYVPNTAPPDAEEEAEFLKTQAVALKEQLETIGQRLAELEKTE